MNRIQTILAASLIFTGLSPVSFPQSPTNPNADSYAAISKLGKGFIIWESNRTTAWRLWRIELDGQGLRQVSPDEPGRDHFCPHISPNGRRLVYLSYPKGSSGYHAHQADRPAVMHVMYVDGTEDRVILTSARAYCEDRAVVWVDDDRFHYIDGQGISREYSLNSQRNHPLTKQTKVGYGWLVNATSTFAITGDPAFCPYNPVTQVISVAKEKYGCQPYFTADGKWGFWMGGNGGPVDKINLATGKISHIFTSRDARLPKERNYIYFPMISHSNRLIAFAASPRNHDHFKSDYDIFVARTDPATLEVIGTPVRYSFDPGCDRYPDVYVSDLELGSYQGEAPYTVQFSAPAEAGTANWSFGDGGTGKGAAVAHTYREAGTYTVQISGVDRSYYGEVIVQAAFIPSVLSTAMRGDRNAVVTFDEPVFITGAIFTLNNQLAAKEATPSSDGLSVTLSFDQSLPIDSKLRIEGVTDQALVPNIMPVQEVAIPPHNWPIKLASPFLVWENAKSGCTTSDNVPCEVKAIGEVFTDHDYSMQTSGGYYQVLGADEAILKGCQTTDQLTIEAVITTHRTDQTGTTRIITYSSGASTRNFTIGQKLNKLVFKLRTSTSGLNGTELELADIMPNRPVHLMVCYAPGSLQCYIDGKLRLNSTAIKGDFNNWSAQNLLLGGELGGGLLWRGSVNGLALYSRNFGASEAAQSYESYLALHPRKAVTPLRLKARLLNSSKIPTLTEILPYREALVTSLYEVLSVQQGVCKAKKILVVQWAIVGGKELGKQPAAGSRQTLVLEPYADNPQLEGIFMSDTLDADPEIPLYYAIGR